MSLALRVAVTAASRVYVTLLGLLVLPMYLRLMGPEAYGLVTLFFVLQAWFQLLDVGFTATVGREAARHRGGAVAGPALAALLQTLERLFFAVLLLVVVTARGFADGVAERWLAVDRIATAEVGQALTLMAAGIAVRVLGELYRGAVAGFERLDWLAACNAGFGTLRLLGVLPLLAWLDRSPSAFFAYQLVVAAVETLTLRLLARKLVPRTGTAAPAPKQPWLDLQPLRGLLRFSLGMSLASTVWVVTSQLDKLLLSGLLSLADYGAFGLVASAAAGVLMATGALAEALVPRFTALRAQDATARGDALYRHATQWTTVVGVGTAAFLACHAERLLWVWTGDAALAGRMAPVLALYALGNGAMAVAAMPYYLQFARGRLGLHLAGTGAMALLLVPALVVAATRHGAVGAGAVWLGVNLLYLAAWTPIVHRRLMPGRHLSWLRRDVFPIAALAAAAASASRALPWPDGRGTSALLLLALGAATLLVASMGSSWARRTLREHWPRARAHRPGRSVR